MLNLNDDANGLEPGPHPGATRHFKQIDDPEEIAKWKEFYRTGRIDIEWLNKRHPPTSNAFWLATRYAIAAYEKSGRMVDAALVYARFGIPVFPCGVNRKRPIPPRDRGSDGEPISGTGGVYKATTDPEQIRNWWTGRKQYLIAVPMGPRSGVWALDVDTAEDHADGTAGWNTLLAQHEPFVTREHRSATGGPHVIFGWDPDRPLGCSKGGMPPGIETKGNGGYIVVPPSRRKGRAYEVFRDSEPIVAPHWIYDLIYEGRPPRPGSGGSAERSFDGTPEVGEEELSEIVSFVPNPDLDWDDWTSIALAIFAASGGGDWGAAIFDVWSEKSDKYDADTTKQRWNEIKGSPPTRTGVGKLRKIAREHGWVPGLYAQPTRYADEGGYISDAKRAEIRKIVREFLDDPKLNPWIALPFFNRWLQRNTDAHRVKIHIESLQRHGKRVPPLDAHIWENYWKRVLQQPYRPPPIVWAMKVVTGGGKTSITIEEIARWLKERGREVTPLIYQVTTHELAEEVESRFVALGVDARIFRGYLAPDPNNPLNIEKLKRDPNTPKKELASMCRMPKLLALAMKAKPRVAEACCKQGKRKCPYYEGEWICPFRRQIPVEDNPEVWVTASDMLFVTHKLFNSVKRVIVDENFYQKGLRGIGDKDDEDDDTNTLSIPLARLRIEPKDGVIDLTGRGRHELLRDELGRALQRQPRLGGLDTQSLSEEIDLRNCHDARIAEWKEYGRLRKLLDLRPGMDGVEKGKEKVIEAMRLSRHLITIWKEIEQLLLQEVSRSGRLWLVESDGLRYITWRGIEPIHKPFKYLPTLLPDAILPHKDILELFYESVQVVADINATSSPHTHTRQVLNAPTSAGKLIRAEGETNRLAVWRYILQQYLLVGRKRIRW